jgi:hypothetical protein
MRNTKVVLIVGLQEKKLRSVVCGSEISECENLKCKKRFQGKKVQIGRKSTAQDRRACKAHRCPRTMVHVRQSRLDYSLESTGVEA